MISSRENSSMRPVSNPTIQLPWKQQEKELLERLELSISLAEEEEVMRRLDEFISIAEEKDLMERLDTSIRESSAASDPGGMPSKKRSEPQTASKTSTNKRPRVELHTSVIEPTPGDYPLNQREDSQRSGDRGDNNDDSSAGNSVEGATIVGENDTFVAHIKDSGEKMRGKNTKMSTFEFKLKHKISEYGNFIAFDEGCATTFVNQFLKEKNVNRSDFHSFARITKEDRFILSGWCSSSIVKEFCEKTEKWVWFRRKATILKQMLQDPASWVLDVEVNSMKRLGLRLGLCVVRLQILSEELTPVSEKEGVWFEFMENSDYEFARTLGQRACSNGGVVLSVAGTQCKSTQHVVDLITQKKSAKNETFTITVCLPKHADLSELSDEDRARFNTRKLSAYKGVTDSILPAVDAEQRNTGKSHEETASVSLDSVFQLTTDEEKRNAFHKISQNQKAVDIDVAFSTKESIGCKLFFDVQCKGGLLYKMKPDGQFFKVMGPDICSGPICLRKVNGIKIETFDEFIAAKKAAGKDMVFSLTLNDGANFSKVDRTKLRCRPRRQNSELYPLHLPGTIRPTAVDPPSSVVQKTVMQKEANHTQPPIAEDQRSISNSSSSDKPNNAPKPSIESQTIESPLTMSANKSAASKTGDPSSKIPQESVELSESTSVGAAETFTTSTLREPHLHQPTFPQVEKQNTPKYKSSTQDSESSKPVSKQNEGESSANNKKGKKKGSKISTPPKDPREAVPIGASQAKTMQDSRPDKVVPKQAEGELEANDKAGKKKRTIPPAPSSSIREVVPILASRASDATMRRIQDQSMSGLGEIEKIRKKNNLKEKLSAGVSFEHMVDATKSLGAYFTTVADSFPKICCVQSIWYRGQINRDTRIKVGTIVEAATIRGRWHRIRTHKDLKKRYDEANKSGSKMTLHFKSRDSNSTKRSASDKEWSFDGEWIGLLSSGWSGGQESRTKTSTIDSPTSRPSPAHREGPEIPQSPVARNRSPSISVPDWTSKVRPLAPSPRHESASIGAVLLEDLEDNDKSNDSTSSALTKAIFDAEEGSPLWKLEDVVRTKTCQDLISLLESDVIEDEEVVDKGLQKCYKYVKRELLGIEKAVDLYHSSDSLSDRKRDLLVKKTILNVFINTTYLLEKAMALHQWEAFEFEIKGLTLPIPEELYGQKLRGRVNVRIGDCFEDLGRVPTTLLAKHIIFTEGEVSKYYTTTNNSQLGMEQRHLVVGFGDNTTSNQTLQKFCVFEIPMNRISEICQASREPQRIKIPIQQPNERFAFGELAVTARRVALDHKYIERKQADALKGFSIQLENITRFNDECPENMYLAPNIKGKGGISILHSAIHLREKGLIQQLLELSMESSSSSSLNLPLAFAMEKVQQERSKVRKLEDSGADASSLRVQRNLLSDFEEIVELLEASRVSMDF